MPLRSIRDSVLTSTSRLCDDKSVTDGGDAAAAVGSDPDEGGVGEVDANPLEGDSEDSDGDGAGDIVRCRYEVDLATVSLGGGVPVDGRSGLLSAILAAINEGEVRTDVE